MKKVKNTLQNGSVRYLVFRDGDSWYAAGLEFNIVESGDTPEEALLLLFEAMRGYLVSARKMKLRPTILNQETDAEYEKMWQQRERGKETVHPIYTSGEVNISPKISALAFA